VSFVCFAASRLTDAQAERWRELAAQSPAASYSQDPAWADVECAAARAGERTPRFFWCERDGVLCLTALGVQRRLPVPGRVYWEFDNGPTFVQPAALSEWLAWLRETMGRGIARLSLQPALALDEVGDEVETILDAGGFRRRRTAGIWTTLIVDLDRPADEVLGSFRRQTRQKIKQSSGLGVEVAAEDDPRGWAALAALDAEMAGRTPVRPIDERFVAAISQRWFRGGPGGTVLVARHAGEPLAAALVIVYRGTAHLRTLPSSRRQRELPATHLLVWDAMRWAKTQGCTAFDLDGYNVTAAPGDPLWGVNQFKRGFAPKQQPFKTVASHDRVFSPIIVRSAAEVRRFQGWRRRSRATGTE
jgi:hypothetical protein